MGYTDRRQRPSLCFLAVDRTIHKVLTTKTITMVSREYAKLIDSLVECTSSFFGKGEEQIRIPATPPILISEDDDHVLTYHHPAGGCCSQKPIIIVDDHPLPQAGSFWSPILIE